MAKVLGFALVTIGFIAGALLATLDPLEVKWGLFSAAAGIGAIGVLLMRFSDQQQRQAAHVVEANIKTVETSLNCIVANMTDLNAQKEDINTYDVHQRLDDLFQDDIRAFVEARESISLVYGLQAYADVMSAFAAAERYLNRVWSASADGYIDEVNLYLERACDQFRLSLNKIRELELKQ